MSLMSAIHPTEPTPDAAGNDGCAAEPDGRVARQGRERAIAGAGSDAPSMADAAPGGGALIGQVARLRLRLSAIGDA